DDDSRRREAAQPVFSLGVIEVVSGNSWLLKLICVAFLWFSAASPAAENAPFIKQHWFEARTAHFNIYSYGPTQEVARVGGRLEQFREAYSVLAGAEAVASPPIVVIAFPTHEAIEPFLPL